MSHYLNYTKHTSLCTILLSFLPQNNPCFIFVGRFLTISPTQCLAVKGAFRDKCPREVACPSPERTSVCSDTCTKVIQVTQNRVFDQIGVPDYTDLGIPYQFLTLSILGLNTLRDISDKEYNQFTPSYQSIRVRYPWNVSTCFLSDVQIW